MSSVAVADGQRKTIYPAVHGVSQVLRILIYDTTDWAGRFIVSGVCLFWMFWKSVNDERSVACTPHQPV